MVFIHLLVKSGINNPPGVVGFDNKAIRPLGFGSDNKMFNFEFKRSIRGEVTIFIGKPTVIDKGFNDRVYPRFICSSSVYNFLRYSI